MNVVAKQDETCSSVYLAHDPLRTASKSWRHDVRPASRRAATNEYGHPGITRCWSRMRPKVWQNSLTSPESTYEGKPRRRFSWLR